MKFKPALHPFPELICIHESRIRTFADIAVLLHLLAFMITMVTGVVSDGLWIVASILIGCLMVMIPFVTEAVIKGANQVTGV